MKEHIDIRIFCLRFLSAMIIMLERVTRHFWRAFICALFFFALWLFGLAALFGIMGSILALCAFIGGVGFFLWHDGRGFRLPSRFDIDRRIERDSAVKGRPLSSQNDRLANPEKDMARNLWSIARSRLYGALPHLKTARIKSFLAQHDPYALRLGVLMAFGLGLLSAGGDWKPRIINGLTPFSFSHNPSEQREAYTISITPPEYTALPQIILRANTIQDETLKVPQGSILKAIVNGGLGAPMLYLGESALSFEESTGHSYALEVDIPDDAESLKLRQTYMTKASWPVKIIPDMPPTIKVDSDAQDNGVEVLDAAQIRFPLSVFDDYGVQDLSMTMRLDPIVDDAPLGEAITEERSVLSPANQDFSIAPVYDLTAHYWAGLPAVFTFSVRDKNGQSATLEPIKVVLPERVFEHPVAKTLVALRKKLAWQPLAPSAYASIEHDLEILLTEPDVFQNDMLVYMAMRFAGARLDYNTPSFKTSREVMALMWDAALRVEDGDLSLTARKLREAQLALEEALKDNNMSDEEIAQRMNALRSAMAEYFKELGRAFQKRGSEGLQLPPMSPEMLAQALNPDALESFLDQLQNQLESGENQSAQEMLSQLQRLLDTLNPSMNAQLPADMQMMQEGVNELEELIKRQESLLEQTEKQAVIVKALRGYGFGYGNSLPQNDAVLERWGLKDIPPSPSEKDNPVPPLINTEKNKAEQDALRYVLGQFMLDTSEVVDDIPPSMGLAEQEMRKSSEALTRNAPDVSVPFQEAAIEFLKQAQEDLSEQFQKRMQQMTGFNLSLGGAPQQLDPLGRPMGRGGSNDGRFGGETELPDEAERRRVQEILKLLRQRAGQSERPQIEREYYRRLLKRF